MFRETLCVSSLTALSPGRGKGGACSSTTAGLGLLGVMQPTDEQVAARLSAPVVTTQLDTRNIAFERSEKILLCTEQKYTGCEKSKLINSFSSATGLAPLICCSFFFFCFVLFFPQWRKITLLLLELNFCQRFSVAASYTATHS